MAETIIIKQAYKSSLVGPLLNNSGICVGFINNDLKNSSEYL